MYFISVFFIKFLTNWIDTESNIEPVNNTSQFLCYAAINFSKGKEITFNFISLMIYLET